MKLLSLRSRADVTTNTGFFAYVISRKRCKLQGKKHAEHCLTHVNKTACEIWSVLDKVDFWVKTLTPFFHRSLQLLNTRCLFYFITGSMLMSLYAVLSSLHLVLIPGTVASWLARSTPERALAGDIVFCSWARHFTLTVPLSTQVYKWVPANLMLGG